MPHPPGTRPASRGASPVGAGADARVRLRPARPDEAPALSGLALRSKGHWGYDDAFLAACRDELTLRQEDLAPGTATVAEDGAGRVLGFVLVDGAPPQGRLDMLFVDPSAIGSGLGRRLFAAALSTARGLGMSRLTIDADPYAEPFYRAMGAQVTGTVPSGSVPGRLLPLMAVDVPPTDPPATPPADPPATPPAGTLP
ncbi:GNAT family N-acetyltransferase [Streptomyces sp. UH6]|nr:GNAT family N-acetyltransferase [Streptomyces sp. UH6]NYV73883.1 GNAT family N-acetyltransferase [Streptomyces sp. UH6]